MNLEFLEQRIKELESAIHSSMASDALINHNVLVGKLQEVRFLQGCLKDAQVQKEEVKSEEVPQGA